MKLKTFLQFFRTPGAFSAISGSLCGLCFAQDAPSLQVFTSVLLASFCLYSAGMGFNDIVDLEKDRELRPERPIPSGEISLKLARILCWALTLLALIPLFLIDYRRGVMALLLSASIALYNGYTKHDKTAGISVGLCRVFNYMMGLGLTGITWPLMLPALAMFIHVQAIMKMAEGEDKDGEEISKFFYAFVALTCICLSLLQVWLAIPWLIFIAFVIAKIQDNSRSQKIKAVGFLVMGFSLMDAIFLLGHGQFIASAIAAGGLFAAMQTGKWIRVG